jgi:glycosyltransferase involved in cell wall biosynthesis
METIIYPPTIDYQWLYQRPQQLMRAFAKIGYRTVFCNYDAYFPQETSIKEEEENFFICNGLDPLTIEMEDRPILWVSYPPHVAHIGKYREKLLVFDAIDEPSDEFEHWKAYIPLLQKKADIIFATAEKIYEYHRKSHPNVHMCPNGADYEHFSRAQRIFSPPPPDLPINNRPIIGYFGAVATWIDWELVDYLSETNGQFDFVFLGPLYGLNSFPLRRKNLYHLGRKDYHALPEYLQYFRVCIIPFKVTSMIEGCNPIKMYEYLSAGKPVVTTAMPEVMQYREIHIGRSKEEFNRQLHRAAYRDTREEQRRRILLAKNNSWVNRALEAAKVIEKTLKGK